MQVFSGQYVLHIYEVYEVYPQQMSDSFLDWLFHQHFFTSTMFKIENVD